MALQPARTKYRKAHKGKIYGNATRGNTLAFGEFGVQCLTRSRITGAQIEAARVAVSRHLKRKGKVWIRIFPHQPITQKPAETRMGRGKGAVEYYVAIVKPGAVIMEIGGVSINLAREALRLADTKLPVRSRFIVREGTV
jgi:large subunit ribosomal protein L16